MWQCNKLVRRHGLMMRARSDQVSVRAMNMLKQIAQPCKNTRDLSTDQAVAKLSYVGEEIRRGLVHMTTASNEAAARMLAAGETLQKQSEDRIMSDSALDDISKVGSTLQDRSRILQLHQRKRNQLRLFQAL